MSLRKLISKLKYCDSPLRIKDGGVTNTKLDKINIPLSGFGAALANIDFGGFKAVNVANPVAATDAANKQYVNLILYLQILRQSKSLSDYQP